MGPPENVKHKPTTLDSKPKPRFERITPPSEIQAAITYLTHLPGFARADAKMREVTDPIVDEMEAAPPPRPRAIEWFDGHADSYLELVIDQPAWERYRVLLYEVWYSQAYEYLFGSVCMEPLFREGIELARKLAARRRHWHRRASEVLASLQEAAAAQRLDLSQPKVRAKSWDEIEISCLSDERVQIKIGTQIETKNYHEMGFEDKRNGVPNGGWTLFRAFAQANGTISNPARNASEFIAIGKRVERMRKALIQHFGISTDPVPREQKYRYCCRFKIGCSPSFQK